MNPLYTILSSAMVESVYRVLLQAPPKGVQRIATTVIGNACFYEFMAVT
jgi:hypothetical protein